MKILCILLATASSLFACFVPPAEDVLLFRRDALQLDANRQILLSKDLITLATRPSALEDSAQRRATAQLIALAATLAPDSKAPLNVANEFVSATEVYVDGSVDYDKPLENISRTVLYLLEDSKRQEHFAIAQLLLDPLAIIAPDLGIVSARPSAEESPRWRRAVAPLASFVTRRQPLPSSKSEMEEKGTLSNEEKEMPPEPDEKPFPKVADFSDSLMVPVFLSKREEGQLAEPRPSLSTLIFEGKLREHSGTIRPPGGINSELLSKSISTAKAALRHEHDSQIVAGIQGSFRFGSEEFRSRNGQILALPLAILAEGLLSERKPLDNLIVLGELQEDGTIEAPKIPWQFLKILLTSQSNEPRRLLIAPQIKPLLLSLLTQQNEDFFFDFDIFEVATLEEAFELSFEGATPENTSQAITKFQEIRRVGAEKSTSVFVSNPHVLARLAEVEEIEPRHLSATLLKIRGSGDHPQNHPTQALAAILQASLMPLSRIPYSKSRDLKAASLETIHEQCRAGLDPLARYVAMSDRKMYDDALDLANRVRTLARAKERSDKESYSEDASFHQSLFFNTYKAIQAEFYQLAKKTSSLLGQAPPKDPSLAEDD